MTARYDRILPTRAVAVLVSLLLFVALPTRARPADVVDLELVLAVDVSSSVSKEEQKVQRAGYVAAFSDPIVVRAILSGSIGRIAVTYVEWAATDYQAIVVPWRLINSEASARSFAAELRAKPVTRGIGTSISAGLGYASGLFTNSGFKARRRVIDISGDGPNNLGPPVVSVRNQIVATGIVINGLPLMLRPSPTGYAARPDLADYYHDCVIGGPGAFVLPVYAKAEIATAIRRKLVQEIAARPRYVIQASQHVYPIKADCMIGQKDFHE